MEIPETKRLPSGTKVRVKEHRVAEGFDAVHGREYTVDHYVSAQEGDGDEPYYILNPLPERGYGEFYAHVDNLEVVMSAEAMAERKTPEVKDLLRFAQCELLADGDGFEIFETEISDKRVGLTGETEDGLRFYAEFTLTHYAQTEV